MDSSLDKWYNKLFARHVDLIGDYAGSELFIIEGDSLLHHCFGQPELDFEVGLQLLHAVYIVEAFLYDLLQRKCVFNIVFIEQHSGLCVPAKVLPSNKYKFHLARAVIVRHLRIHLSKPYANVSVYEFESLQDARLTAYLKHAGAYFVLCHDGADAPSSQNSALGSKRGEMTKRSFRAAIASFMNNGYDVALINDLKFQDTKVWTMVLERSKCKIQDLGISENPQTTSPFLSASALGLIEWTSSDESTICSESQLLTLQTLHSLLSRHLVCAGFVNAILIQVALVSRAPLSYRRPSHCGRLTEYGGNLFKEYCSTATRIIKCPEFLSISNCAEATCDLADFIDGRVLLSVCGRLKEGISTNDMSTNIRTSYEKMRHILSISSEELMCYDHLSLALPPREATSQRRENSARQSQLLPFTNPVFDDHLTSIRVSVDEATENYSYSYTDQIFQDLSHWHNTRPLKSKHSFKDGSDQRSRERALRRNQFLMNDMRNYAASLTNSTGRMLEPETVFVNQRDSDSKLNALRNQRDRPEVTLSTHSSENKKTAKLGKSKQQILSGIAAKNRQKGANIEEKYFTSWQYQLARFENEDNFSIRYDRTRAYLNGLQPGAPRKLQDEIQLYMLDALLRLWSHVCRRHAQAESMSIAALLWNCLNQLLSNSEDMSSYVLIHVRTACIHLGFPEPKLDVGPVDRKISFAFYKFDNSNESLTVTSDFKVFQLEHCGPYMDRSMDSAVDPRTRFLPDKWQRNVLDAIDDHKSLFVVAPTSAGKTFISFYAMKKTLQADNDGVIVYVAPTKALVNQIAAEIQANFRKAYHTPKSVWALHTRDYRVNSPIDCQILVTVPHILQIMLLSPANARSWSPKVKRIIFDEIHCIGQADDGIVWEQLLLLAPCPIIALSATVGNPDEFSAWLESTQLSLKNELVVVQHPYRYSDLRKYTFVSPVTYEFSGLAEANTFGELGLDMAEQFQVMHPVSSLVNRSRGIPLDLHMEPRECLSLWKSFEKFRNPEFTVDPALAPSRFFGNAIRKKDVVEWEMCLKQVLGSWMLDPSSPFEQVLADLTSTRVGHTCAHKQDTPQANIKTSKSSNILETVLPLVAELHSRNALPGILFNYDRGQCEKIGQTLLAQLLDGEQIFKESNAAWKRKVDRWEDWKKNEARKAKELNASSKGRASRKSKIEDDSQKTTKADRLREDADLDSNPMASFNPNTPLTPYTFANTRMLHPSELEEEIFKLKNRSVAKWLCEALARGIGIHHAGMPRSYRQIVEILFRKGFLRIVIATGTLALGINMPCKTVVFSGDSIFLTALNFRQCAGRAGRRGFDLLGNVVFHSLPNEKVCRMVSSRLPSLHGHFPITTSLVLRLFILLHDSGYSHYAKNAVKSLLSQPRLFLGGESFRDQVMHHLRFSIEYLRRSRLLSTGGTPLNFAGCISHLYYAENAAFAFHALLKDGFFHRLTSNMNEDSEDFILREMMFVMAHLFGRKPLRQADLEPSILEHRIKPSPSLVLLPEAPSDAREILDRHNEETLNIFETYVRTFAEQHVNSDDNELPLTKLRFGGCQALDECDSILRSSPPTAVRSHFVALSGHDDHFTSISSLCRTARSGVFLEESVIPYIALHPSESSTPLNAYLYDFYKHGDTHALETANGIRKGDMWFLLNDFSLVLATIVTSFKNYMNLNENADADLVDLQGSGDAAEEDPWTTGSAEVTEATDEEQLASAQRAKTAMKARAKSSRLGKGEKDVVESWEDEDVGNEHSEEDEIETSIKHLNDDGHSLEPRFRTYTIDKRTQPNNDSPSLLKVLRAFERLRATFDDEFRAMWA